MKPISQEAQTPPASAPKTASETFRFELRQPPAEPNKPKAPRVKAPSVEAPVTLVFTGLFGIILPAATIAIELYTHMCAEVFFDPLPTFWHALLVGLAPAANLVLVWLLVRSRPVPLRAPFVLNAVAIGVSCFYALLFLPLAPLAFVAVLFYGLGLLPLAPLGGFVSALLLRRALRRRVRASGSARSIPRVWSGIALAAVTIVLIELPVSLTGLGLRWAASPVAEDRESGIQFLRTFGSEEVLLHATSPRRGRGSDLIGMWLLGDPVSPAKAKEVYYRVTGEAAQPETSPRFVFPNFDPEQGGVTVGSFSPGLDLAESRIDSSVDADAALAYSQWTMVISNSNQVAREARAQVKLPSGAVVSRVTLWINGEEREAAFGARARVREAYERVVRTQRDPLLVTTNGADRILIQCFPVPRNGEMKIRIGITQPLENRGDGSLLFDLPHFVEKNFAIDGAGVEHRVWVEMEGAPLPPELAGFEVERTADGAFALRGSVEDSKLRKAGVRVPYPQAPHHELTWTPDPLDPETHVIQQRFELRQSTPPEHVVVVVDGSKDMQPFLPQIADALDAMPGDWKTGVLVAADQVLPLNDPSELRGLQLEGGADNVPALEEAYRRAGAGDAVILWVHGAQPVLMERTDGLQQSWERRPGRVSLVAIQGPPGPNRILESLDGIADVRSVTRTVSLTEDLLYLGSRWAGETAEWKAVRRRLPRSDLGRHDLGQRTSSHLAKLWANDEVAKLASLGISDREHAVSLATSYQIVTPVSGAVVLETQAQYEQAGLKPADPADVPTIPEPEVWALMLVLTALLGRQMLKARRPWTSA